MSVDPTVQAQLDEAVEFVWKDEEDIMSALVADAQSQLPQVTNYNSGGIFRTILEIFTRGVKAFYTLLANVIRQAFVQTATGNWLDLKVGEIGITRKPALKTEGDITFRRTGTSGNVVIPIGTIVETDVDTQGRKYRFITTEEAILLNGTTSITAPAEAEFAGAEFNLGNSTIKNLVTTIAGVDSVDNPSGWLTREGTDVENDTDLRYRYRLKWEELAMGATKMAYVGYAMEVNGVVDVEVDDAWPRGQGTVDVYITGTNGMPTDELVADVQDVVNAKKPICSDADVKKPTGVTIDATIAVKVIPGTPNQTAMATEALNIVNALFIRDDTYALEDLRFKIGHDVTQDRVILALGRYLTGIKRVDCGFTRIEVDISELAQKGTITVEVAEEAV